MKTHRTRSADATPGHRAAQERDDRNGTSQTPTGTADQRSRRRRDAADSSSVTDAFVHPQAVCESTDIGSGTRIWAFAHVLRGARIGRSCNIGDHAFIEDGVRIGDCVIVKNQTMIWNGVTIEDEAFIGPGVKFTNDRHPRSRHLPAAARRYAHVENWLAPTLVRRGATIGAGAVIVCGVTIGAFASIGAGAVVTRDVPDHRLVVGNPAHPIGWVCRCGIPLDASHVCPSCRREYHRVGNGRLIRLDEGHVQES